MSGRAFLSMLTALTVETLEVRNQKLSSRLQELNTLFELSRDFHSLRSRDEIARLLLFRAMAEAGTPDGLVYLGDSTRLDLAARSGFSAWEPVTTFTSPGSLGMLKQRTHPIWPFQLDEPELSEALPPDMGLLVPMFIQDELRGLLVLGDSVNGELSSEKISFLSTLGNLSMALEENIRLFHEEVEKKRMEEELRVAARIQARLLPRGELRIPGYAVSTLNLSSLEVGGDYFDCIRIDDTHYAICIADVSGKGVPAALLMASLQASLRALAAVELDVGWLATRVNKLIGDSTEAGQFITCFLGILDTEAHTIQYVNAGHDPPLVFSSDGSKAEFGTDSIVLGVMPDFQYQARTHQLQAEDLVVMYTDGVTETTDENERMFGARRLEASVERQLGQPVERILDGLLADVRSFSGDAAQSDDITLFMLRRQT